jgi:hypothetical protein
MKHSQQKAIISKVEILLKQYQEYLNLNDENQKQKIADEMFYDDPIIWMMYKKEAYKNTQDAINSLGDLKEHATGHGICAKRFNFLRNYILEKSDIDILNSEIFANELSLDDFYDNDIINNLIQDIYFINKWTEYEFFKKDSKIAKWQNYTII